MSRILLCNLSKANPPPPITVCEPEPEGGLGWLCGPPKHFAILLPADSGWMLKQRPADAVHSSLQLRLQFFHSDSIKILFNLHLNLSCTLNTKQQRYIFKDLGKVNEQWLQKKDPIFTKTGGKRAEMILFTLHVPPILPAYMQRRPPSPASLSANAQPINLCLFFLLWIMVIRILLDWNLAKVEEETSFLIESCLVAGILMLTWLQNVLQRWGSERMPDCGVRASAACCLQLESVLVFHFIQYVLWSVTCSGSDTLIRAKIVSDVCQPAAC